MQAPGSARSVPRRVALGVGIAEIGASLTFVSVNTWLLYYLVNVAGVSPLLAGGIFVAGRVVDAVTDPLMGMFSDRMRPRWGRLVFVRWGALPLGAGFALLWWAPAQAADASAVVALGALVLSSLLYTVVQMPTLALTPDLVPDYDARTSLTSVRVAFAVVASMAAVAAPPLIVLGVSGGGTLATSTPAGWAILGVVFGAIAVLAYAALPALVREPARAPAREAPTRPPWWTVFRTPGYVSLLAVFLVVTVALMMVNSMLPFALESVLGVPGESQTLVLGLLFGSAVLSFPLWNAFTHRFGKRAALTLGALVMGGAVWALVATAPPGAPGAVLLGWTIVAGVGLASVMATPWSMLPDVVEFDALQSGARREGLLYAVFTFAQKLAGSVGVFANAVAATLFGYVPGVAQQAPHTVAGFALVLGPITFGLFALAAALVWTSPITRDSHGRARLALRALLERPDDDAVDSPERA
ncbi:MFS transporter [soil metagenome]|nr:MFS transporter [Trueperaceae bacterium]